LFGLAAYTCWGLMPLYFKAVRAVKSGELLAHRIVWCVVLLVILVSAQRGWPDVRRCLRNPRLIRLLLISSVLVAANWLVYIRGVVTDRMVQTSLGYFINPLFSILLGLVFLRERLRPWQALAVGLAAAGVAYHLYALGYLPWIALALAGSFGLYGLVRKVAVVDAVTGLTVETLVLLPAALGYLAWDVAHGTNDFGHQGRGTDVLVILSGVATAVPLLFFGAAARRLPLSTLGFLQYVGPSIQLVLTVWVFREPFQFEHAVTFGLIWMGLVVFTLESILARRRLPAAGQPAVVPAVEEAQGHEQRFALGPRIRKQS
jgi:chloramphenicol-sensitive protein RarD